MKKNMDLSIFEKFQFEYQPVGVKFLLIKPEGIKQLDKNVAFCEMFTIAQTAEPFYTTKENHECMAGPILTGMVEPDPIFESGQMGPKLGIYEDPRANRNIYYSMSRLERNTVNYIAYSSLDKLTFDPDLLIVTAKPSQAEILLRAASYRTGKGWNAKGTSVLGCAWLYMYPYVHGEINLMVTGLHHGMKARKLLPEGLLLITLPYQLLPDIAVNLTRIEWDLPQYHWGKEAHKQKMQAIAQELRRKMQE